ncbi:MAG: TolC family protein [Bacteroidota bacterium]
MGRPAKAQFLPLRDAIRTATENYGYVKAKANYAKATESLAEQTRREYLPNLSLSAQQDYGTVNGQNGPLYGYGGLGVASSGLPLAQQNWNSAFGALYLANVSWDFFAFGRMKNKIKAAEKSAVRDELDYEQELFQHKVRVAGTYLNLLAAQRLLQTAEKNLSRSEALLTVVSARSKTGLAPGVDSTLALAEIAGARIALTNARSNAQDQANLLTRYIGIPSAEFTADTTFASRLPPVTADKKAFEVRPEIHPQLRFQRSRAEQSQAQSGYIRTLAYPTFSLFSVFQTRGSGFKANYALDQHAFNHSYADGVNPVRSNYLLGVGTTWNLTSILRTSPQAASQSFITKGINDEYTQTDLNLKSQLLLANQKMDNAISNYRNSGIQLKAATEAYNQKMVLYRSGLSNITDLTQARYILNRAESDRSIAVTNVWQALLLQAASAGDFSLFMNE